MVVLARRAYPVSSPATRIRNPGVQKPRRMVLSFI
jgi:hypothetical protein